MAQPDSRVMLTIKTQLLLNPRPSFLYGCNHVSRCSEPADSWPISYFFRGTTRENLFVVYGVRARPCMSVNNEIVLQRMDFRYAGDLTVPECCKLAAYLVVAIQVANVGPFLYTIVKYIFQRCGWVSKQIHLERVTVTLIVAIGTAACVLLSIFWDRTATLIGGSLHSVAIIVLTFFVALVDCTSSVVFIPFMKHFPEEYISALYIGEGLSGVLPSAVALSQGFANNSLKCERSYIGHRALGIHFSPNVFFIFLAIMMLLCGLAFLCINVLPPVRKHMVVYKYPQFKIKGNSRCNTPAASEANITANERRVLFGNNDEDDDEEEIMFKGDGRERSSASATPVDHHDVPVEAQLSGNEGEFNETPPPSLSPPLAERKAVKPEKSKSRLASIPSITSASFGFQSKNSVRSRNSKIETRVARGLVLTPNNYKIAAPSFSCVNVVTILWTNLTIFVCLALLNFMTNGVLSAVAPYIFFPYGNDVYHLAINLALLANPVMSLFYVLLPFKSRVITAMMTAISLVLGLYLLVCACLNPDPPLRSHIVGKIIIVVVNVCISAIVTYTKVGVVVQLHTQEKDKDTALFLAGVVTQLSSLVGAVVLFALVNYTQVFPSQGCDS